VSRGASPAGAGGGSALPPGSALPCGALLLAAGWLVGVAADDTVPDARGWLAALAALALVALAGWLHRRWNPDERQARELRRLALVARTTGHPVVICDTARRIVWANAAFETLTGYEVGEVLGQRPGALMQCEDTDPETVARIRAALDAGQGVRVEILNRARASGSTSTSSRSATRAVRSRASSR
jgi:PAS domain S-box-containing protein